MSSQMLKLAVVVGLGMGVLTSTLSTAQAQNSAILAQTAVRTGVLTATDPTAQINVRARATTASEIRHYGLVGDRVQILADTRGADGFTWYFVRFPASGAEGWIRGDLVQITATPTLPARPDVTRPTPNVELPPLELPAARGVNLSQVRYLRAETTVDPALETAILRQLPDYRYNTASGTSGAIRYFYNRIDLNGDGDREVLVYLVGTPTCGTGGCTMLIFTPTSGRYELVSRLTGVSNPIVVSDRTTSGWRDLILYVAGGGARGEYRILRFTNGQYPSNPSTQPLLPANTYVVGDAAIANLVDLSVPAPVLIR